MSYFINVENLFDLEKQEKWEDARKLLYKLWEGDKFNCDKLIRLFSECWYVLSLWDCCLSKENISFQAFQNTLIECIEFGFENFMNNSRFLCIAGYMISTLPHLFLLKGMDSSYIEWEQKGIDMLRKSNEIDPNDRISEILNLGMKFDFDRYNKVKRLFILDLNDSLLNETAIEVYFKNVLGNIEVLEN